MLRTAPVFFLFSLIGCGNGEEIEKLRAEMEALKKELVDENVIKSEKEKADLEAAEASKPEWARSKDFLASLDKLMENYQPVLPDEVDNTDLLRCTTDYELSQDPDLKKGARGLIAQKKKSTKDRSKKAREFNRGKWIQYRIDYGWESREIKRPARHDCYANGRWQDVSRSLCSRWNRRRFLGYRWSWKVKTAERPPIGFYSREEAPYRPPELMTRIRDAQITVPDRFYCKVENAIKKGSGVRVHCQGEVAKGAYISVAGFMAKVHKGDVISVPLKGTQREPDGLLRKKDGRVDGRTRKVWVIDADASAVQVDEPATCPSREAILASTEK
jgi:hypothetical protein